MAKPEGQRTTKRSTSTNSGQPSQIFMRTLAAKALGASCQTGTFSKRIPPPAAERRARPVYGRIAPGAAASTLLDGVKFSRPDLVLAGAVPESIGNAEYARACRERLVSSIGRGLTVSITAPPSLEDGRRREHREGRMTHNFRLPTPAVPRNCCAPGATGCTQPSMNRTPRQRVPASDAELRGMQIPAGLGTRLSTTRGTRRVVNRQYLVGARFQRARYRGVGTLQSVPHSRHTAQIPHGHWRRPPGSYFITRVRT